MCNSSTGSACRSKNEKGDHKKAKVKHHFALPNFKEAASVSISHSRLTSPVDSASTPISQARDPASSAPGEDPQLKGNETSIWIPTNDPWVAIKALLQVTGTQVAAVETNHHKKLEAKRDKIKRLESSCNNKEKLLSDTIKKINDDDKYWKKLRNQVNIAQAEKNAMMTERDAAVLALQEQKEQTLDLMSQAAFASAATLLGILKSYNPALDTSLVTVGFNCTTEEAAKLVESVQLVVTAFVESLRLSLPSGDSEGSPSD